MFKFSGPIATMIGRIKSIDKIGLKIGDPEPVQLPPPKEEDHLSVGVVALLTSWERPLLVKEEEAIRANLAAENLITPTDREVALVRSLAGTRLALRFEQIFGMIWNSQALLLYELNNAWGGDGMPRQVIQMRYEAAKEAFPGYHTTDTVETYVGFLVATQLVQENGLTIAITDMGRDFLKFIIDQRKPTTRLVG
jgi:hypothetical protein